MAKRRSAFRNQSTTSTAVETDSDKQWKADALAEANKDNRSDYVNDFSEEPVLYTDGGPSDIYRTLQYYMKGDTALIDRWFNALNNEPESFVFDLFTREELSFVTEDLNGDIEDIAAALTTKYLQLESNMPEENIIDGSNDPIAVEQTTTASDTPEEIAFDYESYRAEHGIPAGWDNTQLDEWIQAEGYNAGKTESGNFVVDPTRKNRTIDTWNKSEILDGFAGKLDGIGENEYGALAKAYRQVAEVDPAWSIRELIDYLTQGLEPSKTSNGAWRNDVTRARRLVADWTTQELIAWALDEIRAVGESTDHKLAVELNNRLGLASQTNDPTVVKSAYKRSVDKSKLVGEQPTAVTPTATLVETKTVSEPIVLQGLNTMNTAYLKTQTERYLAACKPGTPITLEAGAKEQRELDNLFRYILKLEDPVGFGSAMTYFRDFYKANRDGIFSPTYATRFTGSLRPEGKVQETHINLLAIFYVYTDDDKSARKQIDLPYLLSKFPANRQGWLLEFFQRYC